jgi:hypothetical protein
MVRWMSKWKVEDARLIYTDRVTARRMIYQTLNFVAAKRKLYIHVRASNMAR